MSIVYDLSHLKLPEEFEEPEGKTNSWSERIVKIAIILTLTVLITLFLIPKKHPMKTFQSEATIVELGIGEYRLPALGSAYIQDRICIRASHSILFGAQALRIFLHLWRNVKTSKRTFRRKYSKFYRMLMSKIEASEGLIEAALLQKIDDNLKFGCGVLYASRFAMFAPECEFSYEFATHLSTIWSDCIRLSDYPGKEHRAVAVIAARTEEDWKRDKMVVYFRDEGDEEWIMYDDANGIAKTGFEDEEVKNLRTLFIVFRKSVF